MRVNTNHFIATAIEGNLVDAIVDVAEFQIERLGETFDLRRYLDEFRIVVLLNAVLAKGRDFHQFAQGFSGGSAVFRSRVDTQQTIDFVLLLGV
ncbi:hypothetical protein D3C72_889370 [compost metagenome]